jgi:hypothetical protein
MFLIGLAGVFHVLWYHSHMIVFSITSLEYITLYKNQRQRHHIKYDRRLVARNKKFGHRQYYF